MVRDDFWMAATRFMSDLEIRLLERENSAAVDLFDLDHALKVLVACGRAFGRLPENSSDRSSDQIAFLEESVNGLAEEGKVISVRLALFAEMMKSKAWIRSTLEDVGGTKGVGVTFLEETFGASTAPPEHRLHQKAAQAVLKALLPETGTDIKGQMISRQDLLEASGYAKRPTEFDDVIRILDSELRLITPTDPDGFSGDNPATLMSGQYYQLAHDYLVHPLRDWLTRKQRQTRRGRAQILLATAAQSWGVNPRRQSLPSFTEWLRILALTRRDKWTPLERRMVKAAARSHRARLVFVLFILALSCAVPFFGAQYIRAVLLEHQYSIELGDPVTEIDEMNYLRFWIDPMLQSRLADAKKDNDADRIGRYAAALVPTHPEVRNDLYPLAFPARHYSGAYHDFKSRKKITFIHTILKKYDPDYATWLWEIAADRGQDMSHRYFAAATLEDIDPASARWPAVALNIITDHDFSVNPSLSFSKVGGSLKNPDLQTHFRKPLLAKIDQGRESGCPGQLLSDLFPPREALALVADGYLNGHFSLDSLKQNRDWFGRIRWELDPRDLTGLMQRQSEDPEKERRRQLAISWLKEARFLMRDN